MADGKEKVEKSSPTLDMLFQLKANKKALREAVKQIMAVVPLDNTVAHEGLQQLSNSLSWEEGIIDALRNINGARK